MGNLVSVIDLNQMTIVETEHTLNTLHDHMMAAKFVHIIHFRCKNVEHISEFLMKAFVCSVLSNFP